MSDIQTGSGGDITVSAPMSVGLGVGQNNLVMGLHLSISGKAAKGETFQVIVMNSSGNINVSDAGGVQISGARPTCITLTGTLMQVNAALATLTDQESGSGTDTLTTVASDSLGDNTPTLDSPITIAGMPSIRAPASETVTAGVATPLAGLAVTETDHAARETFTVTLTDASGVFAEADAGSKGSGTNSLTIHGDLATVDRDLKALSLAAGGADTIVERVTDSLGNAAGPLSIPVAVLVPAARFTQAAPIREAAFTPHLLLAVGHSAIA